MDRDAVEPNRKVKIEYHNLPEGKQEQLTKYCHRYEAQSYRVRSAQV